MKHLTIILLFVFSLCIAQPPDYGEDDKAESKTKIAHASLGNPYLTSDAPASRGNAHLVIPKMNVLYVGIPNLLKIEIPDPSETYSLSSSTLSFGEGLKFTQGETKYDFIVTPQRATHNRGIIVNVLNSKGIIVATKNIRVKRLPDPTTTILGQKSGLISRGKIKVASRIDAKISNFDYEIKVQVSSFTMEVYSPNKPFIGFFAKGNKLTPAMKSRIKTLKRGEVIVFKDIRVSLPGGNGFSREKSSIVLKVK